MKWINTEILTQPMNYLIVWVIATIWLLAFHTVMTGWQSMSSARAPVGGAGPGTLAAPLAGDPTAVFQPASAASMAPGAINNQWFGTDPTWTDGFEARYPEDGWTSP
jgi:hypothetical protein